MAEDATGVAPVSGNGLTATVDAIASGTANVKASFTVKDSGETVVGSAAVTVAVAAAVVLVLALPASAAPVGTSPSAVAGGGWLAGVVDALMPAGPVVVGVLLVVRGLSWGRSRAWQRLGSRWSGIAEAGVVKTGNVVQVVVGPEADNLAEDIEDLM